ncbi:hypothetical protein CEP51_006743 [Fusarium floridanum]|uniref:Uncharacterized protein n=1 Tax=Fusarium floridanum TaxID=1325733 RepID=A0A428RRP3_9HYPO|nr:hypothetical protein CEP51_006743 [Fusarium floridanum]
MQPFSVGSAMPMDSANEILHLLYSTIWVGSQFIFSHYESKRHKNIAPVDTDRYRRYKSNFDAVFEASQFLVYFVAINLLVANVLFTRDSVNTSKMIKFQFCLNLMGFTQMAFALCLHALTTVYRRRSEPKKSSRRGRGSKPEDAWVLLSESWVMS